MSLISDALRRRDEDGGDQPSKPAGLSLASKTPSTPPEQTAPAARAPVPSPPSPAEQSAPPAPPAPEPPRLSLKSSKPKTDPDDAVAPLDEEALVAARQPKKRKHKAWLELLLVVTILVLLVFGGVGLYVYSNRGAPDDRTAAPPLISPAPATPSTETPPPVVSAPQAPGLAPAETTPPAENVPASTPLAATRQVLALAETRAAATDEVSDGIETTSAPAAEEIVHATPASGLVEEQVVEEPIPAATGEGVEVVDDVALPPPAEVLAPPPVIWPGFSLQAAMGSGKRGSVMIDGSIIRVGEAHGALNILEITPGGVLIEYMGERRVFRVRR